MASHTKVNGEKARWKEEVYFDGLMGSFIMERSSTITGTAMEGSSGPMVDTTKANGWMAGSMVMGCRRWTLKEQQRGKDGRAAAESSETLIMILH